MYALAGESSLFPARKAFPNSFRVDLQRVTYRSERKMRSRLHQRRSTPALPQTPDGLQLVAPETSSGSNAPRRPASQPSGDAKAQFPMRPCGHRKTALAEHFDVLKIRLAARRSDYLSRRSFPWL